MTTESASTTEVDIPRHEDLVDDTLVRWYFLIALVFLGISMLGGLLMAAQLIHWNPLTKVEVLSAGRWRMVHTNAVAYGFIANAFLGMLHWVVPRLTLQKVASKWLSYFIFFAWQVIVLSTAVGLIFGPMVQAQPWVTEMAKSLHISMNLGAQGLEWGETPFWIDPVALLGLALVAYNFLVPIGRAKGPMYVTLWYFMAAFVWTFLTYAMGNFLPEYALTGTSAGAVGGLFIHDLVGLFVTPLGWGMMYYIVPIILQASDLEPRLSLVGFWGLAFLLSAARHPPLSLHTNPDVPSVRSGDLHHRRRVCRGYGGHQLHRHDVGRREDGLPRTFRSAGSIRA